MTPLRQRMIADLRIRNYSPRTVDCYTRCVAAYARHFGTSPAALGAEHIRAYQTYLVETKRASWAVFNQTVCALRFLYGTTLGQPGLIEDIPFPRQPKPLPVVLSPTELARFFAAIPNLKHRTVLMTMYAAGLRILEALHVRVADVDSARQCLRVVQGKGQKDRYTLLPPTLLAQLRTYWQATRPGSPWLFPGRRASTPLDATAVQRQCRPPPGAPGWRSGSPPTPCGTASRRTCWKRAPICARSSSCWGTAASRPRRSTSMWSRPSRAWHAAPISSRARSAVARGGDRAGDGRVPGPLWDRPGGAAPPA